MAKNCVQQDAESVQTISFPLQAHSLIITHDLGEAQTAVSGEIASHNFRLASKKDRGDARLTCARLQHIKLFGVRLGSNVVASAVPGQSVQIVVPLTGYVTCVRHGSGSPVRPGFAFVQPPAEPVRLLWGATCEAIVVWIDEQALDDISLRTFSKPFEAFSRFAPFIDLARGAGHSFAHALRTIVQELDDPNSLFSRGITTRGVSDVLLTSMLYAAVDSESLRAPRHPGANTCAVRRARDYIYAHLNDEILVDQVTRAAGVSLRTLQYEFAKSYGIGPAALIRREKLKRIRAELSAETAGETISEIAGRWGFFDPKYLCRIYLREFGERPSETRRRALSGCKP